MTLYLSRLRATRNPSVKALAAVLNPKNAGQRADAQHRLIWSAFAEDPDKKRDFLWRDESNGTFTVLSARTPGPSPFFEPPEVKTVSPDLREGDRIAFVLRANATRTIKDGPIKESGKRSRKHLDIVMDALYHVSKQDRADQRLGVAQEVAQNWLIAQGSRHGFDLETCGVEGYFVRALPGHRGRRKGQPQFGILDLTGTICLTEPEAFLIKWAHGFGRARAFGCGLMLIRRA